MTGMPIASLEWLEVAYNLTRISLECSVRQTRLIVLGLHLSVTDPDLDRLGLCFGLSSSRGR